MYTGAAGHEKRAERSVRSWWNEGGEKKKPARGRVNAERWAEGGMIDRLSRKEEGGKKNRIQKRCRRQRNQKSRQLLSG